jgi:hypothetical protein
MARSLTIPWRRQKIFSKLAYKIVNNTGNLNKEAQNEIVVSRSTRGAEVFGR